MRKIFSSGLLAVALSLSPSALQGQISVSVEHAEEGESLPARPMTIDGTPDMRYVELADHVEVIVAVFQGPVAVTKVDVPDHVQVLERTSVPNGVAVKLELRNPATHVLRFTAEQGGNSVVVNLYVARKPRIEISQTAQDCVRGQICVTPAGLSHIAFEGENLAEVDLTAGVTIGGQRFVLTRDDEHLHTQVSDGALTLTAHDVVFRTRRPYLDQNGVPTSEVTLPKVRVTRNAAKKALILAIDDESSEPIVFVGQNAVFDIPVPGGGALAPATYTVEETVGQQQRTVVALLDVLSSASGIATVRVLGLAPTVNDLHGHGSFVYIMKRDTPFFHSRISVQERPLIERWTLHHLDSRHRDQSVHPGETALLSVSGRNLLAFDEVLVNGTKCGSACTADHPSPNELRIRFSFAGPAVDRVPILLRSRVTRDTTILLPTAPALQPRPLDFVTLVVDSVHFRPRLRPAFPFLQLRDRDSHYYRLESGRNSLALNRAEVDAIGSAQTDGTAPRQERGSAPAPRTAARDVRRASRDSLRAARDSIRLVAAEIGTNTLHGVRLIIDPAMLDRGGRYGTQHLVVAATLYSPEREKVEEDSIRIAVSPADSTLAARLRLSPGEFTSPRVVSIDDLIDRLGRFSQPGSTVEITVRHDSTLYGGEPGYRKNLRVRNETRFRVRPHAEVLAGAFYIARTRGPRVKTLAPNGAPADTVSRRGEPQTGFDALSLLGSLGIDASVLNHEGRPTFARMRVGLLAMQSPFDRASPRQFGLSFLYPMELATLRGGLALSISAGGVCLANERCFALVSPGFSMTLGK